MAYWTVTVSVGGAIETEEQFESEADLREFVQHLRSAALDDGITTDLYILEHNHEPFEDCQCVQFLQDLRPTLTLPDLDKNKG